MLFIILSLDNAIHSLSTWNTNPPVTWLLKNSPGNKPQQLKEGLPRDFSMITIPCYAHVHVCKYFWITQLWVSQMCPSKLWETLAEHKEKRKRTGLCSLTTQKKPQRQSMPDTCVQQYYYSCLGTNARSLPRAGHWCSKWMEESWHWYGIDLSLQGAC